MNIIMDSKNETRTFMYFPLISIWMKQRPHLHIDFVPFTTGSKRGLETRVSLKQALAAQGFKGGSRGDTEWSQWVQSEKENLAAVMGGIGIEWEHKGTHEKHLSVLDYKKQERGKKRSSSLRGRFQRKKRNFKYCRTGWRITTKEWKT